MAQRFVLFIALVLAGCSSVRTVEVPAPASSVRVQPPDTLRVAEPDPMPAIGPRTMPYMTRVFASPDTASPAAEVTRLRITPGQDVYVRYRTRSEQLAFPARGESLVGRATGPNRLAWSVEGRPAPDTVEVECPSPFEGVREATRNVVVAAREGSSIALAIERLTRPTRWLTLAALLFAGVGIGYGLTRLRN